MKYLLNNKFAPITFTIGFVESPFSRFSEEFTRWQAQLDQKFGTQSEIKIFSEPLAKSLSTLSPLTTPADRYLLTETKSAWSAIFANGLRVNDVHSPVTFLATVLKCRGLQIRAIPDRSKNAAHDEIQIYGAIDFSLYGPDPTDWLNRIRTISVVNDVGGWKFDSQGQVQPFEQTERYLNPKIVDRFTIEMLHDYCFALGIDAFNAEFYGDQSLAYHTTNKSTTGGPKISIDQARSRVRI